MDDQIGPVFSFNLSIYPSRFLWNRSNSFITILSHRLVSLDRLRRYLVVVVWLFNCFRFSFENMSRKWTQFVGTVGASKCGTFPSIDILFTRERSSSICMLRYITFENDLIWLRNLKWTDLILTTCYGLVWYNTYLVANWGIPAAV